MKAPLLALPLALLLLTGCTGGASDSAASGGSAESAGGGAARDSAGLAPVSAPRVQAPLEGRKVVRTAEITVRVGDVRAAADRAADLARGLGGVLAGEQASEERAELQLRVPPARLEPALGQVGRLGEEVSRSVTSEDVTEQVVDLDSRLATQRASVGRVRALLERAGSLGDVVKVEGELAKREAELESLDARARALGAQVDLATLTVRLEERRTAVAASGGFGEGLAAGWAAFVTSARAGATVLGALLPFLPLLVAGGLAWRWRRAVLQRAAPVQ